MSQLRNILLGDYDTMESAFDKERPNDNHKQNHHLSNDTREYEHSSRVINLWILFDSVLVWNYKSRTWKL